MYTYRDYGPVDSFLPEDCVVGGPSAYIIRKRKVIQFMNLLTKLGLKSPNDFLDCPIFDNNPRYHAYQWLDGRRGRTIY